MTTTDPERDARRASALSHLTGTSTSNLSAAPLPPRVSIASSTVILAEKAQLTGTLPFIKETARFKKRSVQDNTESSTDHTEDTDPGTGPPTKSYQTTLHSKATIHPFVKLSTAYGPVTVHENAIIWEGAVVGLDTYKVQEVTSSSTADISAVALGKLGEQRSSRTLSVFGSREFEGARAMPGGYRKSVEDVQENKDDDQEKQQNIRQAEKDNGTSYERMTTIRQPLESGITVHPSASIGSHTAICTPCYIGEHVEIGTRCHVAAGCIIGDWVKIASGVSIEEDTVIPDYTVVYSSCHGTGVKWRHNGTVAGPNGERVRELMSKGHSKMSDACAKIVRVNLAKWT